MTTDATPTTPPPPTADPYRRTEPTPDPTLERSVSARTRRARLERVGGLLLDEIEPGWRDGAHTRATPARWAKWWDEFLAGDRSGAARDTTFPVEHVDQMVVVSGIDTWSLCAHHLLPFSAKVAIGYIADEKVLGLSKFARITHAAAARPTSQEELVASIADEVEKVTGSPHVAVTAIGLHLCMAMRGVKTPASMTTSVTRGLFRDDDAARAEWFGILHRTAAHDGLR